MIKDAICKMRGHRISDNETKCPYTMRTYQTCDRCGAKREKP
jgi:hypothetical protein